MKKIIKNIAKAIYLYIGLLGLSFTILFLFYFFTEGGSYIFSSLVKYATEDSFDLILVFGITGMLPLLGGVANLYIIPFLPIFIMPIIFTVTLTFVKNERFVKIVKLIFKLLSINLILILIGIIVFYGINLFYETSAVGKFQKRHLLDSKIPTSYEKVVSDLKNKNYIMGDVHNCAVSLETKNEGRYCFEQYPDKEYDKIVDHFYNDSTDPMQQHVLNHYLVLYDENGSTIINQDPLRNLSGKFIVFDDFIYMQYNILFSEDDLIIDKKTGKILYDSWLLDEMYFDFDIDKQITLNKKRIVEIIKLELYPI